LQQGGLTAIPTPSVQEPILQSQPGHWQWPLCRSGDGRGCAPTPGLSPHWML